VTLAKSAFISHYEQNSEIMSIPGSFDGLPVNKLFENLAAEAID